MYRPSKEWFEWAKQFPYDESYSKISEEDLATFDEMQQAVEECKKNIIEQMIKKYVLY